MHASSTMRFARRFLLAGVTLAVAACGGGGGGGSPPAAPMLGTMASSVTSSDGKVTVGVGDNALQAPVTISIAPAAPDASIAADPSYVPGTTYAYTAPAIQVPDQVLITIESPLAVGAAAAAAPRGRKFAQAFPPGYQPPPTCLVNAPLVLDGTLTVQNILVTTEGTGSNAQCPQAPAPGCILVFNPNPVVAVCAPSQDVIITPSVAAACPPGYREVTGEAEFAELAAANGLGRVCQRNGNTTPPVLTGPGRTPIASCTPKGGKFICAAPALPSGTYSVLWDKEQPPEPTFGVKSTSGGTFVYKDELETGAVFRARVFGSDPHGYGAAEILEVLDWPPGNAALGNLNVRRVWAAPASAFSGAPVTSYDSGHFDIPWDNADLAPGSTGQVTRRFMARVFDKAGNSNLSNPILSLQFLVARIGIESFTVSPSSVQFPGGPVTLSWSVKGATQISIDNGGGTFTVPDNAITATPGTATVNVTGTTTFTLTATHPMRTTKTATVTVTLGADATPPSVSLAASPNPVVAPGSTTLTATASDNAGVAKVDFFRGATLVGTDTTAPFSQAVAFTPADIGTVGFTAQACDAANNCTTSALVNVTVNADATPPTVSLLANPATVLVPGSTTLQATASDNIGVTKVEFFRGATLIATDTAAPFQTQVDFTSADLGAATFTAKAFDAQNNNATSTAVNVLVTTPSAGDTYASPSGTDAGNTTCAQANPCRSIALAAATAQANKTVWLMNGAYDGTTQPAPIQIPAGLTLRALTPGLAGVGQAIVLQGSATVVGVVLRRVATGDSGWIEASSGIVTIDGVKAQGPYFAGGLPPLTLSGTVQVTMTPGNVADYTDALPAVGQNAYTYAQLSDSARLTVNGGFFGGAVLGGADGLYGGQGRGAFRLFGGSRLDLNNVQLNVDSTGVFMSGSAPQLHVNGSTIHSNVNTGPGYAIHAASGPATIVLVNSTISGFRYDYAHNSRGILVGQYNIPGAAATLAVTNSTVTGNDVGIWAVHGTTPSTVAMTGSGASISNNAFGGVVCYADCAFDIAGGQVSGNGVTDPTLVNGVSDFYGGVWLGSVSTYQLKLRNVTVADNKSVLGGNSNQPGNSGIVMRGSAASTYDLGTGASPGNNVIQGNTTGSQTTGLLVEVAAGVTVSAVGNTYAAGVQGANAQGLYQVGTAPCGASSCNLTAGTGANYRIGTGTLRLAQ